MIAWIVPAVITARSLVWSIDVIYNVVDKVIQAHNGTERPQWYVADWGKRVDDID